MRKRALCILCVNITAQGWQFCRALVTYIYLYRILFQLQVIDGTFYDMLEGDNEVIVMTMVEDDILVCYT